MSIDLNILLLRNKMKLSDFCKEMNVKSYEQLVEHCSHRSIIPCSVDQWNEKCKLNKQTTSAAKDKKNSKPEIKNTTSNVKRKSTKTATRRKPAKASTSQKKK